MEYYDEEPPGMPRQKHKQGAFGCSCDCNYSKSHQGICKITQLFIVGLAWILIGASPYYREIFVIGGVTWPFHIVMLISIVVWICTFFMLIMFLVGYHHQLPSVAWPTVELIANICFLIAILVAACIEAANCWRWDMQSQMYRGTYNGGTNVNANVLGAYGMTSGMSYTQTINFSQYCARRPRDCQDYVNLMMGNNSYYTNHLFATVMLFFAVIAYIVSTYFAYRTWREFKETMSRPGDEVKPSMWMKMQYRFQNTRDSAKNQVTKVFKGNNERDEDLTSDEEAQDIELTNEKAINEVFLPPGKAPPTYSVSVTSEHKLHKSSRHGSHHHSHHDSHRDSHHEHHDSHRDSHHEHHDSHKDRSPRSRRRSDERSTKSEGRSSRSGGRSSRSAGRSSRSDGRSSRSDKSSKSGQRSRGSSRPHSRSNNRHEKSERRDHEIDVQAKVEKEEKVDDTKSDHSSEPLSPTASVIV